MKTLEMDQATEPLAEYARRLEKAPMLLTVHGKPVAALVSVANVDAETIALSTDLRFLALIERSRTRHKAEGGLSAAKMRKHLGLIKPKRKRGA
jgi:antitoxin (DNA-binding transcriptional repressor) of toxin-antitoxin stability system